MKTRRHKGLISVLTGNGKGKTSAAFGMALRAAGQGMRVLILQFMKKREDTGEIKAMDQLGLPITIKQFGRRVFFKTRTCEPMDIHMAHIGLEAFLEAMESGAYDLIILDEINIAVDFHLLKLEEVMEAIAKKPDQLHLILTGRKAKKEILEIADCVTEMKEIKHHYNKGIKAQRGVEF
ncbi:MAG: cob(I)yrinic acid a,c-diamide adenosyltransferase [Desulfobacteraceae bacterium]|jgi:cob(I)alamin adenosyltransferase